MGRTHLGRRYKLSQNTHRVMGPRESNGSPTQSAGSDVLQSPLRRRWAFVPAQTGRAGRWDGHSWERWQESHALCRQRVPRTRQTVPTHGRTIKTQTILEHEADGIRKRINIQYDTSH